MPIATPNDEAPEQGQTLESRDPAKQPIPSVDALSDKPSVPSDGAISDFAFCVDQKECEEDVDVGDVESSAPSRARRASIVARRTARLWKSEFVSLGFGFLALAAIIGVLAGSNGRPPPRLPIGMTMNALVSILIGILYLALNSPLSACLAQLKWNHFHKPRNLHHFQKIDFASRSVHGCLAIFSIAPVNPTACLAAFLFIAIQAIGPFVQQIVSIVLVNTDVTPGASVPISHVWTDSRDTADLAGCTSGNACNMLHSFDESTRDPFKMSPATPSSGFVNCTWDPYWTLAVCYACRDASDLVQVIDRVTGQPAAMTDLNSTNTNRWVLPNGHYLDPNINKGQSGVAIGNFINMTATLDELFNSTTGNVMLKLSVLATPMTLQPVAQECSLQLCAKRLQGGLEGTFNETETGVVYFPVADSPWNTVGKRAVNERGFQPNQTISTVQVQDNTGQTMDLTVNGAAFVATTKHMAAALTGFLETPDAANGSYSVKSVGSYGWLRGYDPVFNAMYNSIQMDWNAEVPISDIETALQNPSNRRELQTGVLVGRMESIASGLTHVVRSGGQVATGTGQVLQLQVHVDWRWLSLPIVLFALTLALLLATVYDTRAKRMNVWSDDALATIVHGMDVPTQTLLRHHDESAALSKVGKEVKVVLKQVGLVKSLASV